MLFACIRFIEVVGSLHFLYPLHHQVYGVHRLVEYIRCSRSRDSIVACVAHDDEVCMKPAFSMAELMGALVVVSSSVYQFRWLGLVGAVAVFLYQMFLVNGNWRKARNARRCHNGTCYREVVCIED